MAKVLVSMPDGLLEALDEAARDASKSRSELVRDALRLYLAAGGKAPDRAAVISAIRGRLKDVRPSDAPEALVRKARDSR